MKQQSLKALKYRKNMFELIDFNTIPSFEHWVLDDPEQNEYYLVYRIGYVLDIGGWVWKPHYTIRRYHNGSFGSKDVKYWIKLSEVCRQTIYKSDFIIKGVNMMKYLGRYPESKMVVDILRSVHNTTTIINHAADYNELNSFLSIFDIWGSRGHFKMSEDKNYQEVWFEATKEFYSISQTDTMRIVFKKFGVKIRHVITGGAGGGSVEE